MKRNWGRSWSPCGQAPVKSYKGRLKADLRVGKHAAWNRLECLGNSLTLGAGGAGFRYEIARKYGLHIGVDVAFSPGTSAIYVQFGSAWMRP